MTIDIKINRILKEAEDQQPITKKEAETLLSLPENSLETALLRATANTISRHRSGNNAILLGQIGVGMAPCDGDCAFCFFAKSHTSVQSSVLPVKEIMDRCRRFAAGGARGVFLMTMHRFGFEWFRDLCAELRRRISPELDILANVGDASLNQMRELRVAGFTTALWRQSNEIPTAKCRNILSVAGFSGLMDTNGRPSRPLRTIACA